MITRKNKFARGISSLVLAMLIISLIPMDFISAAESTTTSSTMFNNPTAQGANNFDAPSSKSGSTSFSNPQFTRPGSISQFSTSLISKDQCNQGTEFNDMMVQIAPLGCSPTIIRSDLLEEQNVPVFCQLEGLKLNPGMDITKIKNIVVSRGGDDKDSSGSEYLSGIGFHPARAALTSKNELVGSPVSDNMGYVVVVVRQIPTEAAMPKSIETNIKATIYYDTQDSFGIGTGEMYLPVLLNDEWQRDYKNYGFWSGRGYLKAEGIDTDSAQISLYSDFNSKSASINLKKGQTSNVIYLPGSYCNQGVKLTLKEVTYPKTKVRLQVDDDIVEVYQGGKFLDNGCTVNKITPAPESNTIRESETDKDKKVDLSGEVQINCRQEGSFELSLTRAANVEELSNSGDHLQGKENTQAAYQSAINKYKEIAEKYSLTKFSDNKEDKIIAGELALVRAITLAGEMQTENRGSAKQGDLQKLMELYLNYYPEGELANGYKESLELMGGYDTSSSSHFAEIDYQPHQIKLLSINKPTTQDIGVQIRFNDKSGPYGVGEYILDESTDLKNYIQVIDIKEDEITIKTNLKIGVSEEGKTKSGTVVLKRGQRENIGVNSLVVETINYQKVARVSLTPVSNNNQQEIVFPFKIGIEKRAIQLSPEKMQEQIEWADKQLEQFQKWRDTLAEVVTNMKAACLLTRVAFSFSDMLFGDGATDARKYVMRRDGVGWFDKCERKVKDGSEEFSTVDACLLHYNDDINEEIANTKIAFVNYNNERKTFRNTLSAATTGQAQGTAIVNQLSNYNNLPGIITADDFNKGIVDEAHINKIMINANLLKQNPNNEEAKKALVAVFKDIESNRASVKFVEGGFDTAIGAEGRVTNIHTSVSNSRVTLPFEDLYIESVKSKISEIGRSEGGVNINDNTPIAILTISGIGYLYVLKEDSTSPGSYSAIDAYKIENLTGEYKLTESVAPQYRRFEKLSSLSYNTAFVVEPRVSYGVEGIPSLMPYDRQAGWFARIEQGSGCVKENGEVVCFTLSNAYKDGIIGTTDDIVLSINFRQGKNIAPFPGLSQDETEKQIEYAVMAIEQAVLQHDKEKVTVYKPRPDSFLAGNSLGNFITKDYDAKCQDFMSPQQCAILFNVCDPVVCPSSRCNFGGAYEVDNVIQSGLIGSIALCLPNFIGAGGDVAIPVCLTGIHAGLEAWTSILEDYRDCNKLALEEGKNVGICDELKSVYVCDFAVKQILPILNANSALSLFDPFRTNKGSSGGGEYLDTANALKNAEESEKYFVTDYAENSKLAFGFKSIDYVSTEICKTFISQTYPTEFDTMFEMESPPQFHAWFDEMTYSEATVPVTSQYKVYYHIFAGNDSAVSYSVYLSDPPASKEYSSLQRLIVDSGTIYQGDSVDEAKDFTAPAGYKTLCVRINGKDECGFKQVTTSFALDKLSETYLADHANDEITNAQDCVSGTPKLDASSFINIQAGVENSLEPEIYNRGLIRVCATRNPGIGGNMDRWEPVGTCDSVSQCWLDTESVKNVIKDNDVEEATLEQVQKLGIESQIGKQYMTEKAGNDALDKFNGELKKVTSESIMEFVARIQAHQNINNAEKYFSYGYQHAQAEMLIADAYARIARELNGQSEEDIKPATTNAAETGEDEATTTSTDYYVYYVQDGENWVDVAKNVDKTIYELRNFPLNKNIKNKQLVRDEVKIVNIPNQ